MPRIDEIMDSLRNAKYFSILDATSGYYQIPLDEKSRKMTAFAWKGGLYEFTRMPFGLCNAPATFQRTMNKIFKNESGNFILPYLDDIIIFSNNYAEHEKHVEIALGRIRAAGLSLNPSKCKFFRTEIKLLGFIVSKGKVKIDPEKSSAIQNHVKPKTISELRSFLGLCNVCRSFVPNYAEKSRILTDMLKGKTKRSKRLIKWDKQQENTFNDLKAIIANHTSRNQPDLNNPFILIADASELCISAILAQKDDENNLKMIYAFSKTMDPAQRNYSVTDKELLAVVKGIEKFRPYLFGRKFFLHTDHKALSYLWTTQNSNSRLLRWALKLQEYNFEPIYIPGHLNIADSLSRKPPNIAVKSIHTNEIEPEIQILHEQLGHGSARDMHFILNSRNGWSGSFKQLQNFVNNC